MAKTRIHPPRHQAATNPTQIVKTTMTPNLRPSYETLTSLNSTPSAPKLHSSEQSMENTMENSTQPQNLPPLRVEETSPHQSTSQKSPIGGSGPSADVNPKRIRPGGKENPKFNKLQRGLIGTLGSL